jgi:hypothetical protein
MARARGAPVPRATTLVPGAGRRVWGRGARRPAGTSTATRSTATIRCMSKLDDPEWRRERASRAAHAAHAKRRLIETHVAAIEERRDELTAEQRRRLRRAALDGRR